jgi:hypothetical protein
MQALRRFPRREIVHRGPHAVLAPRKGRYTQTVCVLLDRPTTTSALAKHLGAFDVRSEAPGVSGPNGWAISGASALVSYRPADHGHVQIDVVDRPWPDAMGNPKDETAPLFTAWTMGHFGPTTHPGALRRAVEQSWRWRDARDVVARHRAFLRIRSTYVFGADARASLLPGGYDPIDELRFVTQVQLALLSVEGALCAFNPNGELLLTGESLASILERDLGGGGLAVDAWANVRMVRPRGTDWLLFDTVGMEQIDVADHEATLPANHASADHVPGLLYSMAAYDAENGGVLGPTDTASDLGGCGWRAHAVGDALAQPPRKALRWAPVGVEVPRGLRGGAA